jgi:hypothetical protein
VSQARAVCVVCRARAIVEGLRLTCRRVEASSSIRWRYMAQDLTSMV